jgi:ribosomal protein S18 acetylase RimI-like enzyme
MSAYEVRRVRADEWPQYRELRLEALKDTPIGFGEWYEDAVEKPDEMWQERAKLAAEAPDTALFAAFTENGQPVGMAGAFPRVGSDREMVIYGVYVSPSHRGPRLGVATLLFDAVIQWARETGADAITLSVHAQNERAHAFYRRYGFVDTGETMPYNLDETVSLIWMRYHG